MKIYLALLCIITFSTEVTLADVWFTPSELIPKAKNETLVQKQREDFHDADFDSLFDLQLTHPIASRVLTDFLDAETKAQRATINGEFLEAFEQYNHLITNLFEVPNVSGVQKITFSALIQRAHLADLLKLSGAERFWREAHAYNPTADMPKSEFAPDLAQRFGKLSAGVFFEFILTVNPMAVVFVDGRPSKNSDGTLHVTLEQGLHQACALTPGSEWSCQKFEFNGPSPYLKVNLDSRAIISGTCEQPEYRGHPLPSHVKLIVDFNHGQCQHVYFERSWFSVAGQKLTSWTPAPSAATLESMPMAEPIEKNWFQELTKSGWFWTGLGVAVVGALVISAQNQQTVVVPSQSYH